MFKEMDDYVVVPQSKRKAIGTRTRIVTQGFTQPNFRTSCKTLVTSQSSPLPPNTTSKFVKTKGLPPASHGKFREAKGVRRLG